MLRVEISEIEWPVDAQEANLPSDVNHYYHISSKYDPDLENDIENLMNERLLGDYGVYPKHYVYRLIYPKALLTST